MTWFLVSVLSSAIALLRKKWIEETQEIIAKVLDCLWQTSWLR
jgi:hypothetical protein